MVTKSSADSGGSSPPPGGKPAANVLHAKIRRPRHRANSDPPVPWGQVLREQLVGYVRMPLLAATVLWVLGSGPYLALADVLRRRGWSERAVFVAGTWLLHETLYVGMNTFFVLCDRCVCLCESRACVLCRLLPTVPHGAQRWTRRVRRRGWLASYKLPRKPSQQPKPELIRRTLQAAFVGHVFVQV